MLRTLACVGLGIALAAAPTSDALASPAAPTRVPGELVLLLPTTPAPGSTSRSPRAGSCARRRSAAAGARDPRPRDPNRRQCIGRRRAERRARPRVGRRRPGPRRRAEPGGPPRAHPERPVSCHPVDLGTTAAGVRARNAWDLETRRPVGRTRIHRHRRRPGTPRPDRADLGERRRDPGQRHRRRRQRLRRRLERLGLREQRR